MFVSDLERCHKRAGGASTLNGRIAPFRVSRWNPEFAGTASMLDPVFADAADTTATPVPATLPLFATGLGGLGLLGWRRKWKARAVISLQPRFPPLGDCSL
jgi:hypothetical protein